MNDWKKIEIKDGLKEIIDYRGFTPPKSDSGIPLISAATVKNGKLDFTKSSFINPENYKKFGTRGFIEPGDVIVTTEAPAGEVALLPDDQLYQLSRRVMALRTDEKKLHNKFLFYTLLNPRTKRELLLANRGTTVPRVLKTDITEFEIFTPKPKEQKEIAFILSNLDDKIDLLQEQNKTLETIAQTIFKEWFGKYQIGEELPEGWRVGKYDDLVYLSSGKGIKKSEYNNNGDYNIIGANGTLGRLDKFLLNEKIIVTGRVGTLGTVFIHNKPVWISDNVLISKTKIHNSFHFTYFTLKGFDFPSLNTGSTQPLITQGDLKSVDIIIPNESILEKFEILSLKLFNKIELNTTQIQTLTKTRDTLLPKLMSGAIRVNELPKEQA